jgi:hypothetical protein
VVLEAEWQITGAHAAKGRRMIRRQGPKPALDPAGTVLTMSASLEELSEAIAVALQK